MAIMLPPEIPDDTPSGAERDLFEVIRDDLSDEWTAVHSLGLANHGRKPWAEIDFVLVGPPGVFCLEVKGGAIERVDGKWYTTPLRGKHKGHRAKLKESPFAQVGSASTALHNFLKERLRAIESAMTGHAVLFPDCAWQGTGPDIDTALIYDAKDGERPFTKFMDRVIARWRVKLGRQRARDQRPLERADRRRIIDEIRGDFALVPSLRVQIDRADRELLRLTDEQAKVFANLQSNPRVIARGGAGTGKTLLAAAEAIRLAADGQRVGFVCYSRNLALYVRAAVEDRSGIQVTTLHSLMHRIIDESGRARELPDASPEDLFTNFQPELAAEILMNRDEPPFDALIVDEGQDLLHQRHLDVLDFLIDGALGNGTWRWFHDPNQNIFDAIGNAALQRLRATGAVDWPLTINCRNTQPIAVNVSLLSGVPLAESLVADGPDVELVWYEDHNKVRSELSRQIRKLVNDGTPPSNIAVLSRRRRASSSVADPLPGNAPGLFDISNGRLEDAPADHVLFSTIASFKGLEADAVFLIDIDDLESEDSLAAIYVGASRARVILVPFLDERVRDEFATQARLFGEQLAAAKMEPPA